jgi:hypothetical protein
MLCIMIQSKGGAGDNEIVALGIIWHIGAHFKPTDHKAFRPGPSRSANCTVDDVAVVSDGGICNVKWNHGA